jgi:hypothetical protein
MVSTEISTQVLIFLVDQNSAICYNTSMKKLDWYAKWVATATLIVGTAVNSLGYYPEGPIILALGGAIWLGVSIHWREASLIVTNGVMLATGLAGLAWRYFG